jgi:hypothetical protein
VEIFHTTVSLGLRNCLAGMAGYSYGREVKMDSIRRRCVFCMYSIHRFLILLDTDNSGEALPYTTCQVWSNNRENVNRLLHAIRTISHALIDANVTDVVTGFGLLNEPYANCISALCPLSLVCAIEISRNTYHWNPKYPCENVDGILRIDSIICVH